jgi:two-component system sensor histidine kinase YesM
MKIRNKLILANLFIVVFLLGSLTYVLVRRSSDLVYEHIIENATLSLSQVSMNLDNKLQSYEEISNTLFLNKTINRMLAEHYEEPLEAYVDYSERLQPFLSAVRTTKDILQLEVYTDNPTFIFANVILIDPEITSTAWYQEVVDNQKGGVWTGAYDNLIDSVPVFSFRKRLNNLDVSSPRMVSLEINIQVLYDLIDQESKSKRFIFTLPNGDVLIDSVSNEKIEHMEQLPFYDKIASATEGSFKYKDDDGDYEIIVKTLASRNSVRGMKVISFVPIDDLTPRIDQLKSLAIVLFLAAFVISAVLISIFSVGITRRLSELSFKMKRVHKDNFESFVVVKGKDEVAQLGGMFNLMVQRLGQLIREVYQSEIDRKEQAFRTKEVELYALQTQINPHFLFNVLNMIRGKLLIVGERDTAKVVGLLAKSFRMMLKSGGQMIRLSEELEFVDNYLQIQQYRFGHKFTYSIDMPLERLDVFIPKLILQPLVENAISHGIELNPKQSQIWVVGELIGEQLQLTVRDDGLGISIERLAEIEQWLQQDSLSKDSNIGLQNVHARLKYMYGEEYGIKIKSAAGEGTMVTIIIPLRSIGGGEDHV